MRNKKWAFNGIKRFYPNLSYENWLKICRRGNQKKVLAKDVVACLSEEVSIGE